MVVSCGKVGSVLCGSDTVEGFLNPFECTEDEGVYLFVSSIGDATYVKGNLKEKFKQKGVEVKISLELDKSIYQNISPCHTHIITCIKKN